jgi:hypothetical protein
MRTFAIHVEGESESANLRELTDNFLQTIRAEEKTVVRAATFSEHAAASDANDQTLAVHELQPTLSEQHLFDQGHRKPAQVEETSDVQTISAGDVQPIKVGG